MHTQIIKSPRISLLITGIAVVLFSTAAATSAPLLDLLHKLPAANTSVRAQVDALPDSAEPRPRIKCPECGVVESMQCVAGEGNSPARYEITVRLRDGSTRVSHHNSPAQWRLGERIILIDGSHRQGA